MAEKTGLDLSLQMFCHFLFSLNVINRHARMVAMIGREHIHKLFTHPSRLPLCLSLPFGGVKSKLITLQRGDILSKQKKVALE